MLDISASIIQVHVVAADLTTVTPGNAMFQFADDTYIVIPARNTHAVLAWAANWIMSLIICS